MLSHTRMGVPYEYTHMGRPIRVWANIRIWGRTYVFVWGVGRILINTISLHALDQTVEFVVTVIKRYCE